MPEPDLSRAIDAVANRQNLDFETASQILDLIMRGTATASQVAGLLIGLRTKGETAEEVAGFALTMREHSAKVFPNSTNLVDLAGTGGGASTFNVSTTAAFVVAGAGQKVAKHGNRSATSKSGSADLLEALGANLDVTTGQVAELIDEVGFGFMFAPKHHPATAHVVPVRKELAVRTVFNILGPLTNPASAANQLIGVGYRDALQLMAEAVQRLGGSGRVLLVHSHDGLDELSISAPTDVVEINGNELRKYTVTPEQFGVKTGQLSDLAGGEPEQNARITRDLLSGALAAGDPRVEIVVLNAAAAIYAARQADDFKSAGEKAREAITSGAAQAKLEAYVAKTQKIAGGS